VTNQEMSKKKEFVLVISRIKYVFDLPVILWQSYGNPMAILWQSYGAYPKT
jgi:hypothetical protein